MLNKNTDPTQMACCVYCLCYLQRLLATRRGTAMQHNTRQVLEVELADHRQPLRNWCLRALGLAIAAEGDEAEWGGNAATVLVKDRFALLLSFVDLVPLRVQWSCVGMEPLHEPAPSRDLH